MPRFLKIALRIILVIVVLYAGLSVAGAILVMRIPRLQIEGSPSEVGLAYTNVSFPARNESNILLKGWYFQGQCDKTILIVHGGFQTRVDNVVDTLALTKGLVTDGYNVLLFDLRGRGESQGKGLNILTNENDIGGAVDFLKTRGGAAHIGIIGFCSGAATAAIFAGQENIGAVVLDGCFATADSMVTRQATTRGIPAFLVDSFIPGLRLTVKLFYGAVPKDPINVVPDISCPVFFIHEQNDNLTSKQETDELFAAAKNPADAIWEIPGALHSDGYKTDPIDYVNKVNVFFSTELTGP
jgi:pimeloyl-ACP methyl ester carboxylesterase